MSEVDWVEICIHTTQEAAEVVSNLLHEAGSNGVVIEDPQDLVKLWDTTLGEVYELNPDDYPETGIFIKGYFPDDGRLELKLTEIRNAMEQLDAIELDFGEKTVKLTRINDEDWSTAWKQYYKPIQVSDHITITPEWEQYSKKHQDELVITLDPGMAFGTGTHQTTVLCIRALEKYVNEGDVVIDIGTGSGILSIAAARLGAEKVFAYDLDPVAVSSAKENVRINQVEMIVFVSERNLLQDVTEQADVIVANLLADIIIRLSEQIPKALKKGGRFIASGIIKSQQQAVEESIKSFGLMIEDVMVLDDWVTIIAKNREAF